MRIPLLRGRTFDASDQPNSPNAAVVSQSLVRKYWPNEDPIGQPIQFGNMDGDLRLLHVVGVVGDVHDYGVDVAISPTIYANAFQRLPSPSLTVVVGFSPGPWDRRRFVCLCWEFEAPRPGGWRNGDWGAKPPGGWENKEGTCERGGGEGGYRGLSGGGRWKEGGVRLTRPGGGA